MTVSADAVGYGAAIEQCDRGIVACGYVAVLAWPRIPAHRRPPPRDRDPRLRRGPTPGTVKAALLAALPRLSARAMTARQLAAATGREPNTTGVRLRQLVRSGEIQARLAPGHGPRSAHLYWNPAR